MNFWFRTLARNPTSPCGRGDNSASIAGIALLGPGIAAVVIAADFPVARRILSEEFDALQPLCALPEIERRHHQPHRAAVLRLERRAGPGVCEQGVLGGKIFQRQIGGVAVMGMQHDVFCFVARMARIKEIADRQPLPLVVVPRPCGHAMDVGSEFCLRLRGEPGDPSYPVSGNEYNPGREALSLACRTASEAVAVRAPYLPTRSPGQP